MELLMLHKEAVMSETALYLGIRSPGNLGRKFLDFVRGKYNVSGYADNQRLGSDGGKGCIHTPTSPAEVMGIETVEDGIVAVHIVTSAQFLALITLIARCTVHRRQLLHVALGEIVATGTR